MDFGKFRKLVNHICVGKQLPDAVYLHTSACRLLSPELVTLVARIEEQYQIPNSCWNVLKFYRRDFKISLLQYPDFFSDPYPPLHHSYTIDLLRASARHTDFTGSDNPPILHRIEALLDPGHPDVPRFKAITLEGEKLGLYDNPRIIGFKKSWERLIRRKGYQLVDGNFLKTDSIRAVPSVPPNGVAVERHLTAIDRGTLSQPMQILARHDYLNGKHSVLDYGCGKGDDIRELEAHGINVTGWDPVHRPNTTLTNADIVNLGFVINVIEDRQERMETLRRAYSYARRMLIVSAMLGGESLVSRFRPYKDGVITSRNTFQKYYAQSELRLFIETSLDDNAIALAPGIFVIFRDKLEEQRFLSKRQHVHREWTHLSPREPNATSLLDTRALVKKHQELFDSFWRAVLDLGRIPANDEFESSDAVRAVAGSHRKAFGALIELYGDDVFRSAAQGRKNDLLVYFALGLFDKRRPYTQIPEGLKRDIKTFFGTYAGAIETAKHLLFSVADTHIIEDACMTAFKYLQCGQLNEGHSLILHKSLLNELPPVLRVYVGCATQLFGDIENVDLVKIHFRSGKVTLLHYDDFECKPIPELIQRVKVKLREQDIDIFDYSGEYKPQPLIQKSVFLRHGSPSYDKQRAFDEKLRGLLPINLGEYGLTREQLQDLFAANKVTIRGFKLVTSD